MDLEIRAKKAIKFLYSEGMRLCMDGPRLGTWNSDPSETPLTPSKVSRASPSPPRFWRLAPPLTYFLERTNMNKFTRLHGSWLHLSTLVEAWEARGYAANPLAKIRFLQQMLRSLLCNILTITQMCEMSVGLTRLWLWPRPLSGFADFLTIINLENGRNGAATLCIIFKKKSFRHFQWYISRYI